MRDFDWTSRTDFNERWVTESFDLSKLRTLDLFLAYWAGPMMTHVIMSFGFEDGRHLAWSVEVRSRKGGEFSPVADLFKSNPLVIIAADERDVVRLRSNIREEDVQLYRLRTPPDAARAILLQYVQESNALAAQPRFYNSITTNCTTAVVKLIRAAGSPHAVRLAPDRQRLSARASSMTMARWTPRIPLEELRARAKISERARAADQFAGFFADHPRRRAISARKNGSLTGAAWPSIRSIAPARRDRRRARHI